MPFDSENDRMNFMIGAYSPDQIALLTEECINDFGNQRTPLGIYFGQMQELVRSGRDYRFTPSSRVGWPMR